MTVCNDYETCDAVYMYVDIMSLPKLGTRIRFSSTSMYRSFTAYPNLRFIQQNVFKTNHLSIAFAHFRVFYAVTIYTV